SSGHHRGSTRTADRCATGCPTRAPDDRRAGSARTPGSPGLLRPGDRVLDLADLGAQDRVVDLPGHRPAGAPQLVPAAIVRALRTHRDRVVPVPAGHAERAARRTGPPSRGWCWGLE